MENTVKIGGMRGLEMGKGRGREEEGREKNPTCKLAALVELETCHSISGSIDGVQVFFCFGCWNAPRPNTCTTLNLLWNAI
jgi:hypothetical protein